MMFDAVFTVIKKLSTIEPLCSFFVALIKLASTGLPFLGGLGEERTSLVDLVGGSKVDLRV